MNKYEELNFRIYTGKCEADKAINSLKGILQGITSDGIINQNENNELELWVDKHKDLVNRNPFREFMSIIKETVSGKLPSKESIEDLYWLCQKYENDNYFFNGFTADLQTLQGLCHGILADGEISDKEIMNLNRWLNENEHLKTYYPYDEIRCILLTILSDGKIEEEERLTLKAYLNQYVNIQSAAIKNQINKEIEHTDISGLCTSDPEIVFQDRLFCITGILKRGERDETLQRISQLGGITADSVTKKTNYLIVGDNGNPAWAFSCYGRKVEKALSLRKQGNNITLVHEFDFFDVLDDLS